MIISFDLTSLLFGLLLPFWFTISVFIALIIGKRFETFTVGSYVEEVVKENNKLITENRELKKELQE